MPSSCDSCIEMVDMVYGQINFVHCFGLACMEELVLLQRNIQTVIFYFVQKYSIGHLERDTHVTGGRIPQR